VLKAHATWSVKVKTKDLNDWLAMATQRHPPPAVDGKRIKTKYMAQTKARPPTFVLFASRGGALPDHYLRYLTNSLRESFDLPGVPLRLTIKSNSANPYAEGGAKSGPERYKGDAKTAPRKVRKKEEEESRLPGKALEQKKTRVAKPRVIGAVKASASKKAGSSVAVQKGARGGARQVSRSGRIRTGQKQGPRK
jgi:GTPase